MPPSACSKRPARLAEAPVNAPFSWPNSSLSISSRGNRRHVDGDEGAVAALAEIVQRLGHQLLAGAGFAGDQHGEVGAGEPGDDPVDLLHRRRPADDRQLLLVQRLPRVAHRLAAPALERALHGSDQAGDVERLRQILEGAALGRPDRGQQRVVGAHHDDRQVGAELLDARQEVEAVLVGQAHVGDHDIALAVDDPAPERARDARRLDVVALPRQRAGDHRADRRVVLGDQNGLAAHREPAGRRISRLS